MDDLTALIVCGGRGRRLGPLAEVVHKTLLPADGAPILLHVVNAVVAAFGCRRVVFLTGHLGWQIRDVIRAYNPKVQVEFLQEDRTLGTADAVCSALRILRLERFVYAHGNVMLGQGSVLRLSAAADCLKDYESLLAVSQEAIAPTHPRVRVGCGGSDPPGPWRDEGMAFSVGFGLIHPPAFRLEWEPFPSSQTLEDYLFPTDSHGNAMKSVDIGADWRHLEDLSFYC